LIIKGTKKRDKNRKIEALQEHNWY